MNLSRRIVALVAALAFVALGVVAGPMPAQAAEEIYPAPASGVWSVDGRAYGHGRGMSQWGAQGAALQGRTADEILAFYYPGLGSVVAVNREVPVRLSAYTPATTVTIWSPEGRAIRMGTIPNETMTTPGRWTITSSGQTVTAERRDSPGGPVTETRTYTGIVRFESLSEYGMVIARGADATTGRWYRGDLRIYPQDAGGFDVYNFVPMEEYLRSVVPRESPASWQPAALQAQAVAARTYAWYKVDHGGSICDTTACQVYYGRGDADAAGALTYSWEHANSDAAIAATAYRVLLYNGTAAFTEFSSSNGGWTVAGGVPYQVAKPDPWTGTAPGDTVTSWSTLLTVARVQQSCPSGGTLRNLVVTGRTGNGPLGGRVTGVRLECTTGNATLSNPAFGMRSSWWRPRTTAPALEQPGRSADVIANGDQMSVAATPNVGVTWTLTVADRSTGQTAYTLTGSAAAGERFNATWFGNWNGGAGGPTPYVGPGTYDLTLSAVDDAGTPAVPYRTVVTVLKPADPPPVAAVPLTAGLGYVAVGPTRLVDTRDTFQSLGGAQRVDIPVLGRAGVPASGVGAVVVNLTAVAATSDTHLRMWPAGSAMPTTSVLNTSAGRTQASMVTAAIGGDGKISLFNAAGTTHYIVDVLGYYTTDPSAATFRPMDPVRVLDTRTTQVLMPGPSRSIDVATALGVPAADLTAVTVNITTTQARGNGYVAASGTGSTATSSVNLMPGADVANRAVVPVVGGAIQLAAVGSGVHVAVDVVGWYSTTSSTPGRLFTPVTPVRVLDSRSGAPFGAHEVRTVAVVGGAVPPGATAVVGTLTAVNQTAATTHARLWPAGLPLTGTSDLNSGAGRTQANAVVTRLGTGGAVQLYNDQGTSHLLLDVVGYFR